MNFGPFFSNPNKIKIKLGVILEITDTQLQSEQFQAGFEHTASHPIPMLNEGKSFFSCSYTHNPTMQRFGYFRENAAAYLQANSQSNYQVKNTFDSRTIVKDISQFPRSIVGYVKAGLCRKQDPKKQIIGTVNGTGVLIDSCRVLTCAHNLQSKYDDYEILQSNISFFPAYHEYIGERIQVKRVFYHRMDLTAQERQENVRDSQDYAILILQEPYSEQVQADCIWSQEQLNKYIAENCKVSTFGYPSDLNIKKAESLKKEISSESIIGYQFESQGFLFPGNEPGLIEYNMLAKEGQSGSPIFVHDGYTQYLIGIHKGKNLNNGMSFGIALWKMKSDIQDWKEE